MFDLDAMPDDLIEALAKDFEEHGVAAIEDLRRQNPRVYLFLVCAIALGNFEGVKGDGRNRGR
jgi:hypothetical protein